MARPSRRVNHLPAEATTFIGRRRELAELRTKLAKARVITLVGPGGVGKSRLAIRGDTDLARSFLVAPGGSSSPRFKISPWSPTPSSQPWT